MPTIRELREARGMTQTDLATAAGVGGAATISRLENGHAVQKSTMLLVCQALGVKLADVTGYTPYSGVKQRSARRERGQK